MENNTAISSTGNYRWKVILPSIFITFVVAYIDRSNISFAMQGIMDTYGVTATITGMISGVFFLGYALLMSPAGYLTSKISPRKILLTLSVLTGFFSSMQGIAPNVESFLVIRFLLGLAEGGIYPVIIVIIATWFPSHERGRATGLFYLYTPFSSIIASPISGYIREHVHLLGLESWRWVIIFQGIPLIVVALIIFMLIPNSPYETSNPWISMEERNYIIQETEKQEKAPSILKEKTFWKNIFSIGFLLLVVTNFLGAVGNWGITMWLPEILKQASSFGYTAIGFITIIPWVIVAIFTSCTGFLNDKIGNKKALLMILWAIAGCFLMLLNAVITTHFWLSILCISIALGTGITGVSVYLTIMTDIYPKNILGGVSGLWNALSNFGGFLGPTIIGAFMGGQNKFYGIFVVGICYFLSVALLTLVKTPKKIM